MSSRNRGEQSSSISGTWKLLTQTAGFVSTVTNRWFQEREDEDESKQVSIESDIQDHLDRISALLLEQESSENADMKNFDLAVRYQLTRIQDLLEETRERKQRGFAGTSAHPETAALHSNAAAGGAETYAPAETSTLLNFERSMGLGSPAERSIRRTEQDTLTKLFSRVRHNRYKEVEAILDSGVSPDVRDQYGNTLIILACQNGNKRIAKICLRKGCDIDAQNFRGQTALHYCYAFGYHELGEYLQSKGARDDIINESMMTCYDGLEPSEVRVETSIERVGHVDSFGGTARRPQRGPAVRVDLRQAFDDDTESLTSTTSGFSTDTTTDTYPSCSSPTLPSFEIETPIRRVRPPAISSNWLRHSADLGHGGEVDASVSSEVPIPRANARRRDTVSNAQIPVEGRSDWGVARESRVAERSAGRRRDTISLGDFAMHAWPEVSRREAAAMQADVDARDTISIGELAEDQARQLEALAQALRALKCREAVSRSHSEPLMSSHQPSPPAALAPAAHTQVALTRVADGDDDGARQAAPQVVTRLQARACGDETGAGSPSLGMREAMRAWERRPGSGRGLGAPKPAPPPLPPPPHAKRILWPHDQTHVVSPGLAREADECALDDFSPYGRPATTRGAEKVARTGEGEGSGGEEDEDLLSARLTCRAAGASHPATHLLPSL